MKTTPRLVVNGTNFNLKNTELYFDPPLQEGTTIQKQVRVYTGTPLHIAPDYSMYPHTANKTIIKSKFALWLKLHFF